MKKLLKRCENNDICEKYLREEYIKELENVAENSATVMAWVAHENFRPGLSNLCTEDELEIFESLTIKADKLNKLRLIKLENGW
jgi:hypothetical protein